MHQALSRLRTVTLVCTSLGFLGCERSPVEPQAGHRIAFVRYEAQTGRLYTMREDGTDFHPLAPDLEVFLRPSWSPDGRRLAFQAGAAAERAIYVVAADGSGLVRVLADAGLVSPPAWSPDGRSIAYITKASADQGYHLMRIDPDGGNIREIPSPSGYKDDLSWSPDGRQLALVIEENLCHMPASGGEATCPVRGDSPAWSPDGMRLAFSGSIAESENRNIYVLDPQGGGVTRLTTNPRDDWGMSWAPDGQHLVFERGRAGREGGYDLLVMNADGSDVRPLSDGIVVSFAPAWQPGR